MVLKKESQHLVFGAIVSSMVLTSCVPASHQSPVSLGVRIDDGVLRVIVPHCPGEGFTEASVTPIDADVSLPEAWTGEGIVVDLDGSVALSPSDWTSVTGSYDGLEWFDVVFRGPKKSAVTVVDDLDEVHGLPEGVYRVDDLKDMSMAEYREHLREESPCP
ncbi:hypothetical protein [Oerskovia jenensis]|uniref:hypothetical protein n=1 Tax=Oerskovia jenensis TaxID=162169 RepID=UPI0036DA1989